jgi:hypothetical protein
MKTYSIPLALENWIESQLQRLGASLSQPRLLADAIKRMADFYVEFPSTPTPWSERWCQQAQLAYYFPLNFLRNYRVFEELKQRNFIKTPLHWYEFGVGLGPSLEAFLEVNPQSTALLSTQLLERSSQAKDLCRQRLQDNHRLQTDWVTQPPKTLKSNSLLIMSYSLTELESLPSWFWTADSIVVIEPSTRDDGRRLMALREEALKKGFHVAAPCTHAMACPLLTQSKRDWCHDRLAFGRPEWMLKIEEHLPFRNSTLTLSYLALQRNPTTSPAPVRVIGDFLEEKGKTRQLICRDSKREFLTFLTKNTGTPPEFFRGDLLKIAEPIINKGDEIRVEPSQISKVDNVDE